MGKEIIPRAFERFKTGDKCKAKLILADDVTTKDISVGGILLETTKRLNINNLYRVQIVSSDSKTITPLALVVRSSLTGTIKKKLESLPLYQVAMKFTGLNDKEKVFLDNLIGNLK
ncbi:MAG: hypothetical protein BMS9Abin21_204 [Thermodesulfovibrionia bacterium]|nr:MAG: hypothetical protein BMS9Abin21_204 [Thermodesulfovibrionia bacterium]